MYPGCLTVAEAAPVLAEVESEESGASRGPEPREPLLEEVVRPAVDVEDIDILQRGTLPREPIPPARPRWERADEGREDRTLVVIGELERQLLELLAEDVRYPVRHAARLSDGVRATRERCVRR